MQYIVLRDIQCKLSVIPIIRSTILLTNLSILLIGNAIEYKELKISNFDLLPQQLHQNRVYPWL